MFRNCCVKVDASVRAVESFSSPNRTPAHAASGAGITRVYDLDF